MKTRILILLFLIFFWGGLLGMVLGQFVKVNFITDLIPDAKPLITPFPSGPPVYNCTSCQNNDYKNYFYNRIVLFGEDKTKKPFVLKLQLGRKQVEANKYEHAYSAIFYFQDKTYKEWDTFEIQDYEIASKNLFKTFEVTRQGGQTTQEAYNFTANVKGIQYDITINDINGDFLVKDTTDYIRFMSEGPATVIVNNEQFIARALVDRIISSDYSKSIFFEGRENLKHETHSLAVWTENDFYLLDFTESHSPELPYESHKWVIYKDKNGYTKKVFDGELTFKQNEFGYPASWIFNIPELNTILNLNAQAYFQGGYDMGVLTGTIIQKDLQLPAKGYFVYLNVNT